MCVNVLLFGPITADMLVLEADAVSQRGVICKNPRAASGGSSWRAGKDGPNSRGSTVSLIDGT